MARSGGIVNYNTFVKGLITEASYLTFPENSSSREENFELKRDGSRARRLGLDFEIDYLSNNKLTQDYVEASLSTTHVWDNAGGTETDNFIIAQVGQHLFFYRSTVTNTSEAIQEFDIDLENHLINGYDISTVKNNPISTSVIKGLLIITGNAIDPFYVSYDGNHRTFTKNTIKLETRDLIGVPDEMPTVDYRPTGTLSAKHSYNLRNQGWSTTNIATTFTELGVWPSNADISHLAKSTTFSSGTADWDIEDIGTYKPEYLDKELVGTTPAPKGRFIYEVFNRSYKDTGSALTTSLIAMEYNNTTGILTTDMGVVHGLSVGDEIQFKDIEINITWTENDDAGSSQVFSGLLQDAQDTLSDGYYEVLSVTSSTFTVSWGITTTQVHLLVAGEYGTYGYVSAASVGLIGTNTEAGVVLPVSVLIDSETERYRPRATAGYAGRAWYAGIRSNAYVSHIFYSQILESDAYIGKCYQNADPTSEHISDLIATDGGYIVIPTARGIQELIPIGQYLFVFSNNGVWRIAGEDGGNFSATNYIVDKVSDVGVYSRGSIVSVENEVYYWAEGGIYKVSQEEVSGNFASVNISQATIQTAFEEIGSEPQKYVNGLYDPTDKKVYWLYNRSISEEGTRFNFNSILMLDMVLGSFYQYLLPIYDNGTGPFIASAARLTGNVYSTAITNVIVGTDDIVVGTDDVVATIPSVDEDATKVKFLTLVPDGTDYFITFSNFHNRDFLDFYSYDSIGTDAAAYMITGSDLQGSPANKKQAHYILMYFNRTETVITSGEADNPSGCLVNVLWDWATDIDSIRAGSQFQAYRLNRMWLHSTSNNPDTYTYGEEVIVTKSKLRGRGRSLSLAMQSEPGKDCQILGWSLLMSGGQRP